MLYEKIKSMLKEDIKQEDIKQVEETLKGDYRKELAKDYIPKEEFNKKNEALKELQEKYTQDLTERDSQLEEMKKNVGSSEELKKKIEELQETNSKTKNEYENKLKELETNALKEKKVNILREKINSLNPKEGAIDLLQSKINLDSLNFSDDGKLIGLDDVISPIKDKFSYMFGETKVKGNEPNTQVNPPLADGLTELKTKMDKAKEEAAKNGTFENVKAYTMAKREFQQAQKEE